MEQTVGSFLRQFGSESQNDWDELLPICALAYNSSKHSSTAYSSNFFFFGRDFRMPLELVLPTPDMAVLNLSQLNEIDHYVL